MIIDDEPLIRRGLESMICWEDMDCRLIGQAASGEEGLLKIREWKPDIVFTDIKMPKMDGMQVCEELRKTKATPIVMLTAKGEETNRYASRRCGLLDEAESGRRGINPCSERGIRTGS